MNPLLGFYFYPRGGSAEVVKELLLEHCAAGLNPGIITGSLGLESKPTNAVTYFRDAKRPDCIADYSLAAEQPGATPYSGTRGENVYVAEEMHGSYEDKAGVADRSFARLDQLNIRSQVNLWGCILRDYVAARGMPSMLHINHLTPLSTAAFAELPSVPLISSLHGTEIKFMQAAAKSKLPHHRVRAAEMSKIALRSDRLLTLNREDRLYAIRELGCDPCRVHTIPNGVRSNLFVPVAAYEQSLESVRSVLMNLLVEHCQAWNTSCVPGSVTYSGSIVNESFFDEFGFRRPYVFCGRFLGFKRVNLLISAYASAKKRDSTIPPLLIIGGSPGEWEGEHPVDFVSRQRIASVFFCGWQPTETVRDLLQLGLALIVPSDAEPFGMVSLQSLACGIPVIASRGGGLSEILNSKNGDEVGWLFDPGNRQQLVHALLHVHRNPREAMRRGSNGRRKVVSKYSWTAVAKSVRDIYVDVAASTDIGAVSRRQQVRSGKQWE